MTLLQENSAAPPASQEKGAARHDDIWWLKTNHQVPVLRPARLARSELFQFGTSFNFRHPYEYTRLLALLLTQLFPNLRDGIVVTRQK